MHINTSKWVSDFYISLKVHDLEIEDSDIPRNPHNFEHGTLWKTCSNKMTLPACSLLLFGLVPAKCRIQFGWNEGPIKPIQLCWIESPRVKSQTVCPFYDLTLPLLETCLLRSFYRRSAIYQESFAVDLFPNEIELHFWTQINCFITLFI